MQEKTFALEELMKTLLEGKKFATIKDIVSNMEPADIAQLFEDVPEDLQPLLFRLIPKEKAAETFVEMDSDMEEALIQGFSDAELKAVVDELFVDDAADIVEEMPANVVKRILQQAEPETRKMINEILNYPEDSAGSIMTTEYVSLRPKMTAEEAIKRIRRTGVEKETIYTCYVTQNDKVLVGYVSLKTLILAEESETVESLMDTHIISVTTADDQELVAQTLQKYDFTALPVVDKENRLVGIITVDDAIDVIQEEATEDIEIMAAITPSDKPYLKTSPWDTWKARIPWLMLLMLSATFTGIIITKFENALAACVVLTAFIPMLMDTGGNSGSQASVSIIRSLSLGDVEFSDLPAVIWKELRVALLSAASLGVVAFGKVILVDRIIMGNPAVTLTVALVVALTMAVTVVLSKLIGGSLPILAQKLGLDPAVVASPFITTIVDALSLLIYFSWARMLLGI
jgi:magnesium transporter